MTKRIAIIGGGAAGMMVAATIVECGGDSDIHIFEKNKELGTKVRISGGGRCNVTTGYFKKQDLQKKYTRGRDFLAYAMGQFGPRKMQSRCEEHGVPLHCEEDLRVFPASNNSKDIVGLFEHILHQGHVKIHFNEGITSIHKEGDMFIVTTPLGTYEYDIVVLTTGGNAYSHTGSSGEGYTLAQSLGHSITHLGPSLNSFLIQEDRIKQCSGISFEKATLYSKDNNTIQTTGPLLLTHFGISGPVTFSYSSQIPYIPISEKNVHYIRVRPFADKNEQYWLEWFNGKATSEQKKQLSTILHQSFTKRWVDLLLDTFKIDGSIMMSNVPRDTRKYLANLLGEGFSLSLIARRPGDEFVTAGGINTDEVYPETMESKLCPGLFFAGEILNIDAVTGGFNFQSCWATGRCAGNAITNLLDKKN